MKKEEKRKEEGAVVAKDNVTDNTEMKESEPTREPEAKAANKEPSAVALSADETLTKKKKDKKKARKKALKAWRNFFIKLSILALIGYLLMTFVFSFAVVKDNVSMQPRLSSGDLTLLYRVNLDEVKIDEIIAYTINGQMYYGRVKGKPGDVIDITESGALYINNAIISETNSYGKTLKDGSRIEFPYTVPEGSYFVLGDNREHCFDSRVCGAIKYEDINGKLIGLLRRRGF